MCSALFALLSDEYCTSTYAVKGTYVLLSMTYLYRTTVPSGRTKYLRTLSSNLISSMKRAILMLATISRGVAVTSPRSLRERLHAANYQCDGKSVTPFSIAFRTVSQMGHCVAVHLPKVPQLERNLCDQELDELQVSIEEADLHPAEVEHMRKMQFHKRILFAGGRVAMRHALRQHMLPGESAFSSFRNGTEHFTPAGSTPVLPNSEGAPVLPKGWLGSISHTHGLAAAFASECKCDQPDRVTRALGIDVEATSRVVSSRLARRCLAVDERQSLGMLNSFDLRTDTLLRFSLKEALYKAIHPLVRQTIAWHSVTVWPASDGSCRVDASNLVAALGVPIQVEAQWEQNSGFFVSTASASLN